MTFHSVGNVIIPSHQVGEMKYPHDDPVIPVYYTHKKCGFPNFLGYPKLSSIYRWNFPYKPFSCWVSPFMETSIYVYNMYIYIYIYMTILYIYISYRLDTTYQFFLHPL